MTDPPYCTFRSRSTPGFRFELRPAATAPERTVAVVYRREGSSLTQCGVGSNLTGEWKDSRGKPLEADGLYWAAMVADG